MNKILLVEDSKEIYRMVKQATAGLVQLDLSESIEGARKKLEGHEYSLLLLDVELPDGNGIEFCSEVQAQHRD